MNSKLFSMSDTELLVWIAERSPDEATALDTYARLRKEFPGRWSALTPRWRGFLRERIRARRGDPPRPMPVGFWPEVKARAVIRKVVNVIRRRTPFFEPDDRQEFDRSSGQSYAQWLRHGDNQGERVVKLFDLDRRYASSEFRAFITQDEENRLTDQW